MKKILKWGIPIGVIVVAITGTCLLLVLKSKGLSDDDECTLDVD